jgi:hypothetical protein
MGDPVYTAVICARIGLLFSEPSLGQAFASWIPVEKRCLQSGIEVVDGLMHYDRERVKAMTTEELRQALARAAKTSLEIAVNATDGEHHVFDYAI